jgi:hypothetical protein
MWFQLAEHVHTGSVEHAHNQFKGWLIYAFPVKIAALCCLEASLQYKH